MRSTKRLRNPLPSGLTIGAAVAIGSIVVSCSSSEEKGRPEPVVPDASLDASAAPAADAAEVDALPARDSGPVDASLLPVTCASPPCAVSLVTTMGDYDGYDTGQGFCAQLQDGTVACWGANRSGQLGRGEGARALPGSAKALRVADLSDVVELDHTCAVDKAGAVWCWGTGPFLRDETNGPTTEHAPVRLPLPPAKHVGFGGAVACAAADDGVTCWGQNVHGQIAPLETAARYGWHPPHPIALPAGAPVRRLAIGNATFIVRDDGTTVSLGRSPPLGRVTSIFPDPNPAKLALSEIVAIDVATDNACAASGGTGYCWGAKNWGAQPPSEVLPKPIVAPEPLVSSATTTLIGTTTANYASRWCATAVSGAVYCWGFNESGQAGDGTTNYALEAVRVVGLPGQAAQVKVTNDTTCALLTSGKIYCWGSNIDGQLGNGKPKGMTLVPEEVLLP